MIPFPKRTRAVFCVIVVIHENFLINSNWFVCNLKGGNEIQIQQIISVSKTKSSPIFKLYHFEQFIVIPIAQIAPNRGCLTAMKSELELGANLWLTL